MTPEEVWDRIKRIREDQDLKQMREERRRVPMPEPRYDEVYFEGVKWLDSLAEGEETVALKLDPNLHPDLDNETSKTLSALMMVFDSDFRGLATEKQTMTEKTLNNSNINQAKMNVPDLEVVGNGDMFQLLSKASSQSEGWMKSTKAMEIKGNGCLVQVTTQQRNPDGSWAVAEALAFVPFVKIETDEEGNRKLASSSGFNWSGDDSPSPLVVEGLHFPNK